MGRTTDVAEEDGGIPPQKGSKPLGCNDEHNLIMLIL
jgi:hypothetical protein